MKSPMGLDANLPVMDLLKEAVGILYVKRAELTRRFMPLILVMVALDVVGQYVLGESPIGQLLTSLLAASLSAVVATGAHRMTLRPQEPMYPDGYFGATQLSYIGRSILISMIAAVICVPAMMTMIISMSSSPEGTPLSGGVIVFMVASVMLAIYVSSRLMITLPEVALSKQTSFSRAWKLSQGNGSRMAIVVWILPIVMMIPALLLMLVDSLITLILGSLISYIATLVGLVTLSLAYQFVAEFSDDNRGNGNGNDDSDGRGFNSSADPQSDGQRDDPQPPRSGGFDA